MTGVSWGHSLAVVDSNDLIVLVLVLLAILLVVAIARRV